MRVLGSSVLVDRPSDRMYTRTTPMFGCMDRRSRYSHDWPATVKPAL